MPGAAVRLAAVLALLDEHVRQSAAAASPAAAAAAAAVAVGPPLVQQYDEIHRSFCIPSLGGARGADGGGGESTTRTTQLFALLEPPRAWAGTFTFWFGEVRRGSARFGEVRRGSARFGEVRRGWLVMGSPFSMYVRDHG